MAGLQARTSSILGKDTKTALSLRELIPAARKIAPSIADALTQIQDAFEIRDRALRKQQEIEDFAVTDPSGRVIFWAGTRAPYRGFWAQEGYIGGDGPANAPLYADENGLLHLSLGDGGGIVVVDGDDNVVVEIGEFDGEYGIWASNIWIGGTGPADAPFFVDDDGNVVIEGGHIYLGPGSTGEGGQLFVYSGTDITGWLGSGDIAAAVNISSISSGTVNTSTAHGLSIGEWAKIAGTNDPVHNDIWQVATTPTTNSFTATGLSGSSAGGTSTKQALGGWLKELRVGGTTPDDAPFFVDSLGNLTIGKNGYALLKSDADDEVGWIGTREISSVQYQGGWVKAWRIGGPDTENAVVVADEDGNVSITDASIQVSADGGDTLISISPDDGIRVENTPEDSLISLENGHIVISQISDADIRFDARCDSIALSDIDAGRMSFTLASGFVIQRFSDPSNIEKIEISGAANPYIDFNSGAGGEYRVNGVAAINASRAGNLSSLTLSTDLSIADGGTGAGDATNARNNLDVYSRGEVDALIAGAGGVSLATFNAHTHAFAETDSGGDTVSGTTDPP